MRIETIYGEDTVRSATQARVLADTLGIDAFSLFHLSRRSRRENRTDVFRQDGRWMWTNSAGRVVKFDTK